MRVVAFVCHEGVDGARFHAAEPDFRVHSAVPTRSDEACWLTYLVIGSRAKTRHYGRAGFYRYAEPSYP
jgi:hypothetical protein